MSLLSRGFLYAAAFLCFAWCAAELKVIWQPASPQCNCPVRFFRQGILDWQCWRLGLSVAIRPSKRFASLYMQVGPLEVELGWRKVCTGKTALVRTVPHALAEEFPVIEV